jgi:hypothetical protein
MQIGTLEQLPPGSDGLGCGATHAGELASKYLVT